MAKMKFVAVVKGNCWLTVKDEVAPLHVKTGDVFVLPTEWAFVLAGDLNAPQAAAARIFGDAIDNIARTGDGDDFMASMRRLNVALFLSDSAVGIILCLAYRKSETKRDRPPIVTVGVPAIDTSLAAASATVPFTGREPLSTITSDGPCVADTTGSRDAAPKATQSGDLNALTSWPPFDLRAQFWWSSLTLRSLASISSYSLAA
jgi:Cupin